jgi:hypothetical protein
MSMLEICPAPFVFRSYHAKDLSPVVDVEKRNLEDFMGRARLLAFNCCWLR